MKNCDIGVGFGLTAKARTCPDPPDIKSHRVDTSFVFYSAALSCASVLSFLQQKESTKESAALCPIAPRDKGLALRYYPSALLSDMALVFLSYRLPDD